MKRKLSKLLALLLCMAMLATVTPIFASADTVYYDWNPTAKQLEAKTIPGAINTITSSASNFVAGWNLVSGNVTFTDRIRLTADVNLILANNATLTANNGIEICNGANFAVYAQTTDDTQMGKLIVPIGQEDRYAGIGPAKNNNCGNISIYGGILDVHGGSNGAGIGSALGSSTAGAGQCGDITIYGGVVTAVGGNTAAGIGAGFVYGCGAITINGGAVDATGGDSAAAIGGGYSSGCGGVTVNGGSVKAIRGAYCFYGGAIGTGDEDCPCPFVTITGGSIVYGGGIVATETTYPQSTEKDGLFYINCALLDAEEATCLTCGHALYYEDGVSNEYYSGFPFKNGNKIGSSQQLESWKKNAGKTIDALGHDYQMVDSDIHKCTRCHIVQKHIDEDNDLLCDICECDIKEVAVTALQEKAGVGASEAVTAILDEAIEAVQEATNHIALTAAKDDGLTAIALQQAKEDALATLEAFAGNEMSEELEAVLEAAETAVNNATTLAGVQAAERNGSKSIFTQLATEADAEKQAVEAELAQAKKDLAAANASLKTANDTIAELNDTIKDKDATIAEKQAALDTATEQLNTAKADLETAQSNLETAKANIEELEGTVSEQDEALKQAAKDLEDKQEALDEMTENYNEAKTALETAQKDLADTTKALNEAKAANEQLQKDLAAANASLKTANDTIAELNNTVKSKDATIAEKQAALDTATEQLNVAKADLETAQSNLETAKANIEELEGTVSEQDEALKQAAQDLKDAQDALDEMTENYNEAKTALETAQKDLADTTKALDEANASLKTANDAIAELNNTIKSKDATIAEKQAALDTATEQLNAAKAQVTALESTVSEQDEALKQAEQEIQDLQAEIERLKALLDDDPTDPQPAEMLGDANNDGAVNMKDVLLMRKYLADTDDAMNMENADCNGDGDVNMKDVLMLRKYLAELVETLGA